MNVPVISMLVSFAVIPLIIVLYFGIEDKNKHFFDNGNGVTAEYKIIYNKQSFHLGEMVSHYSLLVTVCMVGIFLSVIGHLFWMEKPQ